MMVYVVFGGLWSAGLGGIVKLILLCISSLAGGIIVLSLTDGYHGIMTAIEDMMANVHLDAMNRVPMVGERYNNLLARGAAKDIGSGLSVILGVLATQSYAQGIWAAKTDSAARKGAMWSALLTIPIGAACVLIGLYMRGHYVTAEEMNLIAEAGKSLPENIGVMATTAQAFPLFITHCMPEFLGGIVLGTLLITVIIGGSGLTLGSSTILVRDVFMKINPSLKESSKNLKVSRLTIVGILLMSVFVAATFSGSFINDLGFLSMGLRSTAVFIPLTLALFFPKRFKYKWIITSIIAGTAALILTQILKLPVDGIFVGLGVSVLCSLMGMVRN
jgi:SSS family solute:Na+ symporter